MKLAILIPCKDLDRGKSRLADCLTPLSRRKLCEFFLCRTLDVACAVVPPAQVRVVTGDPRAEAIAAEYGAAALPDSGEGLNAALEHARTRVLAEMGACGVLVLPIDLPLATPAAVSAVAGQSSEIALVADERLEGTNLLRLAPPAAGRFGFCFGPMSYQKHCAAARASGDRVATVHDPSLMFDVDLPEQYGRWAARDHWGAGRVG